MESPFIQTESYNRQNSYIDHMTGSGNFDYHHDEGNEHLTIEHEATDLYQEKFDFESPLATLSPRIKQLLPIDKNTKRTKTNQDQLKKAGLTLPEVYSKLELHIDTGFVRAALLDVNNRQTSGKYVLGPEDQSAVDAVFTETVHQYQISNYSDPNECDGILGQSTLDTLGFTDHGLRSKTDHLPEYKSLLKKLNSRISAATNGKWHSDNWFTSFVKPAWLGAKISSGIHPLLYEKLLQVQRWLLTQPGFTGLNPAQLGQKLGVTRVTGSRATAAGQGMHAYGLAIDIDSDKNPWIGAGWIKNDPVKLTERSRILKTFTGNPGLQRKHSTVFEYLHDLAMNHGTDTYAIYDLLQSNNTDFKHYLIAHPDEHAFWKKSATFDGKTSGNGFLQLNRELVYALRQIAGLAWGAVDFGPRASGDIMHFDFRMHEVGNMICNNPHNTRNGFVPDKNNFPPIQSEIIEEEQMHFEAFDFETEDFSVSNYEVESENEKSFQQSDELNNHHSHKFEQHFSFDFFGTNWSKAVELNRKYSQSLGWDQFHHLINDLVLPFSGQSQVSLNETEFAKAVAGWQRSVGFSETDSDGIIGPVTWRTMQQVLFQNKPQVPVISIPATPDQPSIDNVAEFNRWYASAILDIMSQGYVGELFNSRSQLNDIVRGNRIFKIDPSRTLIQVLPIMYHIADSARRDNYREIVIGSFIRDAASDGKCTGHCAGQSIDINHSRRDFSKPEATQMVVNILQYLTSLPERFKAPFGFGMPLQGDFFGNRSLNKFKSVSPSLLGNSQLRQLVPSLGYVFPDNNNHLHIQVKWNK